MKRLFPVLLVLLLIPCMVVPASASTVDAIWDTHDELGEWLGTAFADINDLLSYIGDALDWVDTSINDIYDFIVRHLHSVLTSISDTLSGLVTPITTGFEYVKGIHDQILIYFGMKWPEDKDIRDEAGDKETEIDDVTDIFATAPTIDQDAIDEVISDVGGQFEDITTDENGLVLFGALGDIADSEIGRHLIPTSAMLGVLSFILFGKVF